MSWYFSRINKPKRKSSFDGDFDYSIKFNLHGGPEGYRPIVVNTESTKINCKLPFDEDISKYFEQKYPEFQDFRILSKSLDR